MMTIIWAAAALAGCTSKPPEPERHADTAAPSSPAAWVRARAATDGALLEAPAKLVAPADAEAVLSAPFPARVVRLRAQLGQPVAKGAPVLDVVMPQVLEAAGIASGALARVEAWEKRKVQLAKLDKEGLARLGDVVEAETQLAEARAALDQAKATLQAAGLTVKDARALLDEGDGTMPLRTPVAGIVVELDAKVGETRSDGTPLARVAGPGLVRVEARLTRPPPEGATYSFAAPDGSLVAARLQSASPRVDPRDGSFPAWLTLDGRTNLPAGTPGTLRIQPGGASDVVAVPARAVRLDAGRALVFVRRGEGTQGVDVEVVASSGAESLVRPKQAGALAEGAEVAADAAAISAEPGSGT